MSAKSESSQRGFDRSSFVRPISTTRSSLSSNNVTTRQSIVETQTSTSSKKKDISPAKSSSIVSFFTSMMKPSTVPTKPIVVVEEPSENLYGCYQSENSSNENATPSSTFSAEPAYMNPKHNNFMGKLIASANTGNKISKSLQSLTMHEVKYLLECLDMNDYIQQFMQHEICGSILREIYTNDDLHDCNIVLPDKVAKTFLKDLDVLRTKCLSSVFMV